MVSTFTTVFSFFLFVTFELVMAKDKGGDLIIIGGNGGGGGGGDHGGGGHQQMSKFKNKICFFLLKKIDKKGQNKLNFLFLFFIFILHKRSPVPM